MDREAAIQHLDQLPPFPQRKLNGLDRALIVAAPLLAYSGGLLSVSHGVVGLIVSAIAALIIVTIRTVRLQRLNEPRLSGYTYYLAIFVAVFTFLVSYNMWQSQPPVGGVVFFLLPLLPVAMYVIYLFLEFRKK